MRKGMRVRVGRRVRVRARVGMRARVTFVLEERDKGSPTLFHNTDLLHGVITQISYTES